MSVPSVLALSLPSFSLPASLSLPILLPATPVWLDSELVYLLLSIGVALLIWFEGQKLKQTQGKLPKSTWFHLSSLMDTAWFFVSLAVFYFIDLTPLAMVVPVAYGIYTVFGWIYGTRLIKKNGLPDSAEDLVIPEPYVAYSQSFAVIFLLLCVTVIGSTRISLFA